MLRYDDPYSLAALFHLNSEPWGNQAAYEDPHGRVMEFKTHEGGGAVPLPDPTESPLTSLIAARRSCRSFGSEPVTTMQLAALLEAAYGVTGLVDWGDGLRAFTRAVPSGGARYPLELYALCQRVKGVDAGIHHFNARDRTLYPIQVPYSIVDLSSALLHQVYVREAAVLVMMAAVFPRVLNKYGARGYRYALIECGHAAQNLCLRAAELGLVTLCVGGFYDRAVNSILRLDPWKEGTLYIVAVGHDAAARAEG
jgi:SagB-type dehydrogenase family enzyme